MTTPIFLTGATGYIGGTVLTRLLKHPKADVFAITVLVRNADKAEKLNSFGVKAEIGSHADAEKLERLASEADVVITTADVDDLEAAKTILRGMRKRYERTGKLPILIHTSGTSVLCDSANGMYGTETIYSDMNIDQIESLPPTAVHRPVESVVNAADVAGYIRSYIISPSNTWGFASGPLIDARVQSRHSTQSPLIIKTGLARGEAMMIGEGKNFGSIVYIEELIDLYMLVFNAALSEPNLPHGREGYYFGANDEEKLIDVYKAVAKALYELGKVPSPEPTTMSKEEVLKYWGMDLMATTVVGGNSRCRPDRGYALGWRPVRTIKDKLDEVKVEVEAIVNLNERLEFPLFYSPTYSPHVNEGAK